MAKRDRGGGEGGNEVKGYQEVSKSTCGYSGESEVPDKMLVQTRSNSSQSQLSLIPRTSVQLVCLEDNESGMYCLIAWIQAQTVDTVRAFFGK